MSSLLSFVVAVAMTETIFKVQFGPAVLSSAFSSKLQAIRWSRKWLTTLEPGVQQSMCLRTVYLERQGWGLKMRFDYMSSGALEDALAALQQLVGSDGAVVVLSSEEVASDVLQAETYKEKQIRRVGAVGNYERTSSVVSQLGLFIGKPSENGPTKRQRRAALAGMELLNRSHRIGSAGLREAHSDEEVNEEGNEE